MVMLNYEQEWVYLENDATTIYFFTADNTGLLHQ